MALRLDSIGQGKCSGKPFLVEGKVLWVSVNLGSATEQGCQSPLQWKIANVSFTLCSLHPLLNVDSLHWELAVNFLEKPKLPISIYKSLADCRRERRRAQALIFYRSSITICARWGSVSPWDSSLTFYFWLHTAKFPWFSIKGSCLLKWGLFRTKDRTTTEGAAVPRKGCHPVWNTMALMTQCSALWL